MAIHTNLTTSYGGILTFNPLLCDYSWPLDSPCFFSFFPFFPVTHPLFFVLVAAKSSNPHSSMPMILMASGSLLSVV